VPDVPRIRTDGDEAHDRHDATCAGPLLMPLREMWCTNPACRNHVHYQPVQWTENDMSGPGWPVTDSCRRCGGDLVTEDERARLQDADFEEEPA